jgi:hypothetical protein
MIRPYETPQKGYNCNWCGNWCGGNGHNINECNIQGLRVIPNWHILDGKDTLDHHQPQEMYGRADTRRSL